MPSTDLLKLVSPTKERDPQPLTLKKDLSHIAISPLTFAFGKSGASLPPPLLKTEVIVNTVYADLTRSWRILSRLTADGLQLFLLLLLEQLLLFCF